MSQEDKRLKRRVRSSYFISTVSIAMVLFLLGATTWLILNALNATQRLREGVVLHVMLADGLTVEQTSALRAALELNDVVREVNYIPKAEAARAFIAESGEDFTTFLGDDPDVNPLPDSFEVGLAARGSERKAIEAFVAQSEAMDGVDEVVYQRGVVEQIGTTLNKFNLVLLLFGGTLLIISFVLLHNTVRMTIIAKRRIISTMKSVGANASFIMRPFAWSAVLHGFLAGVIATGLFALLVLGLQEGIPELSLLKDNVILGAIVGGMVVLGIVISLLFTVLAVHKAVRQQSAMAQI
jgi:cell division transport system permease protein